MFIPRYFARIAGKTKPATPARLTAKIKPEALIRLTEKAKSRRPLARRLSDILRPFPACSRTLFPKSSNPPSMSQLQQHPPLWEGVVVIGAGEGIRTLDINLGKDVFSFNKILILLNKFNINFIIAKFLPNLHFSQGLTISLSAASQFEIHASC